MVKSHKILIALLVITISAIIIPASAQEMCDKCKANPENCKLMTGGECENPDGCQDITKPEGDKKTIEKKIIVLSPDENRGFLGVYTETKDGGVVIEKVVPESPAEKAGMTSGMIITVINGTKVKTREELIDVLKNTKPKDTVSVVVKSDGKEKTLKVILAEVPKTEMQKMKIKVECDDCEDEDMEMLMTPKMECPKCGHKMEMNMPKMKMKMMGKCPERGMTDEDMEMCPMMGKCPMMMEKGMPMMPMEKGMMMPPKETRGFIGIVTEEEDGKLVIQSIVPNSPAQKAGLKEDDIISEINGVAVMTPSGLIEVLKTTKPGDIARLKIISGGVEKMVDVELGIPPAPKATQMKIKFGGRRVGSGGGAGYFGPGMTFFDFDDLNSIFTTHNLPELEKQQFTFGGGGWGQAGRVRIGGYGTGGTQTISNDTLHIENAFGAGFFELGYSVVSENHLLITPLLGIGGGGISMKITSLLYNPISLDSVLTYPGGVAKVSKGELMMYPGLSIDIPISFVGLSLKGGYMWSPLTGSWMMEDFGKINGPDLKLSGPFASLNVMFGGFSKHHK